MNLKEALNKFEPFDAQEIQDKKLFLEAIDKFDDVLTRNNLFGHFSSTALVLNEEKNKILVVYHNILDGWVYPGGHADGEENLLNVALREVEEETNLKVECLSKEIFAIQSCPIRSHIKHNNFVNAHTHYDCIFLFNASDKKPIKYRVDESKGCKWINIEDFLNDNMVFFLEPIHKKLISKLKRENILK